MSFITDIREVSESALGQAAERFSDLPRPLLAAIGAGDFAVEQLAELREALTTGKEFSAPSTDDVKNVAGEVRGFANDLPHRIQEAATGVVESVQKFAADAPAMTQQLVAQLPAMVTEIREALSADQLRGAVDGYTQLAGAIYGSLADRGDKTWHKVVAATDSKVVEASPDAPAAEPASIPTATPIPTPVKVADQAKKAAVKAAAKAKPATAANPAPRRSASAKPGPKPATRSTGEAAAVDEHEVDHADVRTVEHAVEHEVEHAVESPIVQPEPADTTVWTTESPESTDSNS